MKKLLLLLAALLPICLTAEAQQARKAIEPYQIRNKEVNTSAKSTTFGGRWYSHYAMANEFLSAGLVSGHLLPIWYDSSVLQNYTTGLAPIEYISAAQIIDPIHFTLWNDANVADPNAMAICEEMSYNVDSISFAGAYIKNPNRPANVVDTLIISVSPTSTSIVDTYKYYTATAGYHPWVANYVNVSSPDSVLRGYTIDSIDIDVPNRASNVGGRVLWKVPLTDADRQEVIGGVVDVMDFTYPVIVNGVPGSCNISLGFGVAVTITFKSGDTITPDVDTFSEYHHLLLWSGEGLGDSTTMPYFYYTHRDRNMSNLMQYSNDSVYQPSVFLEGRSDSSFAYEFHGISAHLFCNSCSTVGYSCSGDYVPDFLKPTTIIYPNPANEFLTISFAEQQKEEVSVSIINVIGQVVAKKEIDKATVNLSGKVSLSTSELQDGIYFYTIRTNGQPTSGRFTVVH